MARKPLSRVFLSWTKIIVVVGILLGGGRSASGGRPYSCAAARVRGVDAYRCYGARHGAKRLLRALQAKKQRGLRSVIKLTGRLNLKKGVFALRRLFDRETGGQTRSTRGIWRIGALAQALADLNDTQSAARIRKALRRYEKGWWSLWRAMLAALAQLDPGQARAYATDVLTRVQNTKGRWERGVLRAVLPLLVASPIGPSNAPSTTTAATPAKATPFKLKPKVLRCLRRLSGKKRVTLDLLYPRLLWARMRLGDSKLLSRYRALLANRKAAVPVHPHHYVAALGNHPADVFALLRFAGATSPEGRQAYFAIERLITTLKTGRRWRRRKCRAHFAKHGPGPKNTTDGANTAHKGKAANVPAGWQALGRNRSCLLPAAQKALIRLAAGLHSLTAFRENKKKPGFSYSLLGYHHGVLARLGSAQSRKRLLALCRAGPRTAAGWVAAERALALGISGSRKCVAKLAANGLAVRARGVLRPYKRRLMQTAARVSAGSTAHSKTGSAPSSAGRSTRRGATGKPAKWSAGWTALLLDWNKNERNFALHHFSRTRPPGACRAVAQAISKATCAAAADGLLALSALGKRCRRVLRRLVRRKNARACVRGTAFEVLSMQGDPALSRLRVNLESISDARVRKRLRVYLKRARQIKKALFGP